ncbi:hypothetical protein FR483_n130L [Paramecium bursaria Chlorella virus FR483]|uniref:Uncharacterized protein n130L n=1 Tax=Paramecium bursaria Chlorella virus FR483 TaxID=399781 RepID=A7J6I4_PBCVF|nr:hypothetical protein FR483_n130L [Paramecium bursaria Chlorella virus FR483]ABT15415.1 hypothetical protein FR483_n130L [Paramecium bursaria Chlorella virus FR483]
MRGLGVSFTFPRVERPLRLASGMSLRKSYLPHLQAMKSSSNIITTVTWSSLGSGAVLCNLVLSQTIARTQLSAMILLSTCSMISDL